MRVAIVLVTCSTLVAFVAAAGASAQPARTAPTAAIERGRATVDDGGSRPAQVTFGAGGDAVVPVVVGAAVAPTSPDLAMFLRAVSLMQSKWGLSLDLAIKFALQMFPHSTVVLIGKYLSDPTVDLAQVVRIVGRLNFYTYQYDLATLKAIGAWIVINVSGTCNVKELCPLNLRALGFLNIDLTWPVCNCGRQFVVEAFVNGTRLPGFLRRGDGTNSTDGLIHFSTYVGVVAQAGDTMTFRVAIDPCGCTANPDASLQWQNSNPAVIS